VNNVELCGQSEPIYIRTAWFFSKVLTQICDFDLLLTFGERKVNLPDYTSKSIDHLGLVSALCQKLGIAEFIDNQIPNQSEYRHISYGQLLVAMILNGLGFVSRTLHMYPDYFADKPVETSLTLFTVYRRFCCC
jgi:hypothetical protein